MTDATAKILAAMNDLGLTVSSSFVPLSKSRNAGEDSPSLNWRVTLERNGKAFLTADYSAGAAHAPSYRAKAAPTFAGDDKRYQRAATAWECEHGVKARPVFMGSGFRPAADSRPILPDSASVVWSLVQDSSVLDYCSFEAWASEYGYDTDSRKAESTWRACMDIALQLRAAIGDAGMEALRVAGEDF